MPFNSSIFIGFLAGATAVYYLVPRLAKPYFLLLASYAFYLYQPQNARLVVLLIAATLVTWAAGLAIGRLSSVWARRGFLLLALAACLGILFFYKYAGFFGGIWAGLTGRPAAAGPDLIAPLGLSYFTFQSLGYVIDVYQHQAEPEKNPLTYALFVSFFPCIFTGPIERKQHLLPQLTAPRPFDYSRAAGGAARVLWGYVKKMVIADNLAVFVRAVYQTAGSCAGPYLAAASLLFSYQLYMDFSGCCDIAIGGAQMLGVDLLENFDRPFAACSYTELWNRWHISLTSWFRDYIFTPLSFYNRGASGALGKLQGWFNVFIIFPISGLWHGAGVGYVVWGVLNGLFLVVGKATARWRRRLAKRNPLYRSKLVKTAVQRCCVYLLFTICIVFFACELYGAKPLTVYGGMFSGWGQALAGGLAGLGGGFARLGLNGATAGMLALAGLFVALVEARGPVAGWFRRQWFFVRWPVYYALCLLLLFFGAFGQSAFIYQQY